MESNPRKMSVTAYPKENETDFVLFEWRIDLKFKSNDS
ncbi:hypothetical protein LEP1GSC026_4664 [Leptospira interrogans str. 2002000623]|nr:hypothetical protein LEP1GSC027_4211 [Leptospira interrogans str. 2002000624]EKQ47566.1 hypothetical protein LEP1GSC026_4664 [Leptospira interrogans str. 2002000623]